MIAPRRFLPSIPSLLALEAVARLGSVTAAAQDLALTHSAVSRQLNVLEDQLGVALLRRDGRGVALTESGRDYGVVRGRGRNPTLRLWPTIFSGKIDVFPGDRRSRLISSMTSVAPA